VRVAEEDGIVCGLVAFRTMADEAEILNLAVDSTRRRRGIGSRLMKDALASCKEAGVKKIFLEVRDSNVAARNFYWRMGFIQVGRRREYYSRPQEDALVLVRTVE
jgi:[ribosomal protein S18]-alanine N-acetyltransferase